MCVGGSTPRWNGPVGLKISAVGITYIILNGWHEFPCVLLNFTDSHTTNFVGKPNLCKVLISACPWMSVQIWNVRWIFLLIDDCGYLFSYSPCSTHNPSSFGIGNEVGFRVGLNSRISDGSVSFWDYTPLPPQRKSICAPPVPLVNCQKSMQIFASNFNVKITGKALGWLQTWIIHSIWHSDKYLCTRNDK